MFVEMFIEFIYYWRRSRASRVAAGAGGAAQREGGHRQPGPPQHRFRRLVLCSRGEPGRGGFPPHKARAVSGERGQGSRSVASGRWSAPPHAGHSG